MAGKRQKTEQNDSFLFIEPLEARMMLSTVEIIAAGSTGEEVMELRIDDVAVQSWTVNGGEDDLQSYVFETSDDVIANQVRIQFTNDLYDVANGIDRNLRVDAIVIDGTRYETEAPEVYSTGSWKPEDGVTPGFRLDEYLHANGYFQFSGGSTGPSSSINIVARGDTGNEQMTLHVNGIPVRTWSVSTEFASYTHQTDTTVTADNVRVYFTNDVYDPARGLDYNLVVDRIEVDSIAYETEDPSVFSTGTWLPEDGIIPGNRLSEVLHTNGYFQFVDTQSDPGGGDPGGEPPGGEPPSEPTDLNGAGFSMETIASGLVLPTAFAVADDGRIFVAEKKGRIQVVENGQVVSTLLDISDEVASVGDRGLIGLALDPNFAENGYVYYHYTVLDPDGDGITPDVDGDGRVEGVGGALERVQVSAADPNVADMSTRTVVLDGHRMTASTHSVGDIDFDNAGNLIFTWGDGGFGDIRIEAQDPNSVQGKLFRIDPVTLQGIPENPFYDAANPDSVASKVWALGIRNSWKLTVDRATGDIYMGEVTDRGPEEINVLRADGSSLLNFGWPYFEGDNPKASFVSVTPPDFVYESPLVALPHLDLGGGDAITGGAIYRGDAYPSVYDGRYFFGSIVPGLFYTADQDGNYQQFGNLGDYAGVADIQLGPDGHIWMMSLFTGTISRLVYDPEAAAVVPPTIAATQSASAGQDSVTVQFDASESTAIDGGPLTFAWDFESDGVIDSTLANPTTTFSDLGTTTTTLTVTDGVNASATRTFETTVLETIDPLNLALGKPTVQSPTAFGGLASRAVDGNTNGTFGDGSTTLTIETKNAHWEVDLGDVFDISTIRIFERTDPSAMPLEDFVVLVSELPFTSGNLEAITTDPGVFFTQVADIDGSITVGTAGSTLARGRYVRISRSGIGENMSLAEVQVFGTEAASPGQFVLANNFVFTDEESGIAQVTVNRVNGSSGEVTVDFATADDTAIAGLDYVAQSGTLTFADGEVSKTIDVAILADDAAEDAERFTVTLSNPLGGASLVSTGSAEQIVNVGRSDYQVSVDGEGNGMVDIDLEARKAIPDQVFYVDANATGDQSGSSAENAFLDIDQALLAIQSLSLSAVTVNVAPGTYQWGESGNLMFDLNIIGAGPDQTVVRFAADTDFGTGNRYVARLLNNDYYIEGITFDGAGGINSTVDVRNLSRLTVVNSAFNNGGSGDGISPFGDGLNVLNVEDVVVYQSSATGNDRDGFSYSNPAGNPMFVLEAFVNSSGNGLDGMWSSQGSTAHESASIVRVGNTFENNPTNISDVTSGTSWNVDVTSSNPLVATTAGDFLNYNISGGGTAWIIGGDYSAGTNSPIAVRAQTIANGAEIRYVDQFGTLDPAMHTVIGTATVDNSVLSPAEPAAATVTILEASAGFELVIYARGEDGREAMSLEINGTVVEAWQNIGTGLTAFVYRSQVNLSPSDVRINFTNNTEDPDQGVDYNLVVDRIEIDSVAYETEAPTVFSTGTLVDGVVTPGFQESELLHVNGYFQYGVTNS